MLLFQPAPPTRFDLNFTLAGFPVRVHPSFWLVAVLFSISSRSLLFILIWVAAIFISILLHELGHAVAFRRYGQSSSILLHYAGGLTIPETIRWGGGYAGVSLSPNQHILVSLAGPGAGFLLAGFVIAIVLALGGAVSTFPLLGFIPIPSATLPFGGAIANSIVSILLWVNVFWGLINLVPVYPLDGGNVSRNILLQFDPWDGVRKSLWISVGAGAVMALLGLVYFNSLYMTILFGLLAFQSYQSLQGRGWGF